MRQNKVQLTVVMMNVSVKAKTADGGYGPANSLSQNVFIGSVVMFIFS